MTGVAIYVEGGGAGAAGKSAIRIGMNSFLTDVRERARAHGLRWKIVACGSREATYDAFKHADSNNQEWLNVLLVDSESIVTGTPVAHLADQDRWKFEPRHMHCVHLMAQVMETWFVADSQALTRYFGQGFQAGALPGHADIETVEKALILRSLQAASKKTAKRGYHKIADAARLLETIDPAVVSGRCPHCQLLFAFLGNAVIADVSDGEVQRHD